MLRYLTRRFSLSMLALLLISMMVFGLSKCVSREPALELDEGVSGDLQQQEQAVRLRAGQLGLDKPLFYFTLTTAAYPDTMYRILPLVRREQLKKLCAQTGNWPAVTGYETALRTLFTAVTTLPDTLKETVEFRFAVADLMRNEQLEAVNELFAEVKQHAAPLLPHYPFQPMIDTLQERIAVLSSARTQKMLVPAFHWHGADNQYHRWLSHFVTGDLGYSTSIKKPVWESLRFSLYSTMVINGLSLILAYLIAVPLGVAMARRRERAFDRVARWALLVVYSMPVFWLGSLLILLLATPGSFLQIVDGIYLEPYNNSGKSYGMWCLSNAEHFILPVLTLCLHILAILALQMRGGILENIGQDFVRTARAKGVGEGAIYRKHIFRNALFPIITVFASLFPVVFTGSLVIEYLFQFPGLGLKMREAFLAGDISVLMAIIMLAAFFTILGNLLADLLYAWVDPRVRFARR